MVSAVVPHWPRAGFAADQSTASTGSQGIARPGGAHRGLDVLPRDGCHAYMLATFPGIPHHAADLEGIDPGFANPGARDTPAPHLMANVP
jgi:hypothetical protein